jgi:hypothetical protein
MYRTCRSTHQRRIRVFSECSSQLGRGSIEDSAEGSVSRNKSWSAKVILGMFSILSELQGKTSSIWKECGQDLRDASKTNYTDCYRWLDLTLFHM